MVERKSIFSELIMQSSKSSDLLQNEMIIDLRQAIMDNIKKERNRISQVRQAKSEPTVYKTEGEVLQIEQCFANALKQIAPEKSLLGLTALEYCSMCIYYNS